MVTKERLLLIGRGREVITKPPLRLDALAVPLRSSGVGVRGSQATFGRPDYPVLFGQGKPCPYSKAPM